MSAKILVTGAPGNVGTEVVKGLQAAGVDVRIGAYHTESARATFGEDADIVQFDFLKPETFHEAFNGIERVFLVRPPAISNVSRDVAPAVWAAVGAGIKQIVFLSIQGVEKNPIVPHHKIEKLILQTGVPYTFLRASFFMQNLSTTHRDEIRDRSEIVLPVGDAMTSFIDVRDIAEVAVQVLTEDGYENAKFTLTGAEALNYDQVAAKLTTTLSRPIQYTRPSLLQFVIQQLKQGKKFGYTLVVAGLYTITRFGNAKEVTGDVATILHREPITFDQFAHDYREVWT
ncbi:MAG: SDR family oxidoreductase [Aggregatilineales bacterium]